MRKIVMLWMIFCLSVVTFACESNDPEVDDATGSTEQTGDNDNATSGKSKRGNSTVFK